MTHKKPSKLIFKGVFTLALVLLPFTHANADYEAPAYIDAISAPITIPGISVGGTYQNRQIAGSCRTEKIHYFFMYLVL